MYVEVITSYKHLVLNIKSNKYEIELSIIKNVYLRQLLLSQFLSINDI